MPTKKKSKRSPLQRHTKIITSVALAAVIIVVAYLVITSGRNPADAKITAPLGTVDRARQINTSELSQEQAIDAGYDSEYQATSHNDAAAMAAVEGAVQDEN